MAHWRVTDLKVLLQGEHQQRVCSCSLHQIVSMREVRFHSCSIDATTKWLMSLAHLFLTVSLKITVNKNFFKWYQKWGSSHMLWDVWEWQGQRKIWPVLWLAFGGSKESPKAEQLAPNSPDNCSKKIYVWTLYTYYWEFFQSSHMHDTVAP
jgi:hypothetical protein